MFAPELLGKLLVHKDGRIARLVELESYAQDDPASHSYHGQTPRNRSMFGPARHLYVYLSYGVHWCTNTVCGQEGNGAAVLFRAPDSLEAIDLMRQARSGRPFVTCAADRELRFVVAGSTNLSKKAP